MLSDHVTKYAKAYSAAGTGVASNVLSEHVANIAMWTMNAFGFVPPEAVAVSFRYVFIALATGVVTMLVGNRNPNEGP